MTHGHVGHDISVRPCCHTPREIIGFSAGMASAIVWSMTNTTLNHRQVNERSDRDGIEFSWFPVATRVAKRNGTPYLARQWRNPNAR